MASFTPADDRRSTKLADIVGRYFYEVFLVNIEKSADLFQPIFVGLHNGYFTVIMSFNFCNSEECVSRIIKYSISSINFIVFSGRELTFTFAIYYRPSVCLSSVCL